jgi:hemerythrin
MSTPPEPLLEWTDGLLLGFAQIDAEHRAFVDHIRALQQARSADEISQQLNNFAGHAREHFTSEDQWMTSTDFPPRQCHIDEHAAVLKSVAEVQALVAAGNTAIVQSLADELARWFPGHAQHLDSALAAWLSKRRWNAAPVVLRRGVVDGAGGVPFISTRTETTSP